MKKQEEEKARGVGDEKSTDVEDEVAAVIEKINVIIEIDSKDDETQ